MAQRREGALLIEISEVRDEWWRQRIDFLLSRANSHLEHHREILRHRACAATLLRDAGCLSLMREELEDGRKHLMRAGELLLELGLAAGLPMISMFSTNRGEEALRDYRELAQAAARRTASEEQDVAQGSRDEPLRMDSREGTVASSRLLLRTMLSVVQTDILQRLAGSSEAASYQGRDSERADLNDWYGRREVGETGLSVRSYLDVAYSMETVALEAGREIPFKVKQTIELLGRLRAAKIEEARRDTFNWQQVPRPAELLDLNCLLLMRTALIAGCEEFALREWLSWEHDEVVGAPLDVAVHIGGIGRDREPDLTI